MKKPETSIIPQESIDGKMLIITRLNDFVGQGDKMVMIDPPERIHPGGSGSGNIIWG